MAAPMDINILYEGSRANLEKKVLTAFRLGYSAVAINVVTDTLDHIPSADYIKVPEAKVKQLGIRRELVQYSRITVILSDKLVYKKFVAPNVQAYDILAVRPTTDKHFQLAVVTLDADIVSVDFTEHLSFFLNHRHIKRAMTRHQYLEISYAPTIRDRSLRKNVFSNVQDLLLTRANKRIIVSSACENCNELRAPKDVMNLAMLMGLSEIDAKDSVTTNCRAVLVRGASRKTHKRAIAIERISQKTGKTPATPMVDLPPEDLQLEEEDDSDEFDLPENVENTTENAENVADKGLKRTAEDDSSSSKKVKTDEDVNGS